MRAARRPLLPATLAGLLALGLVACEDLLQEPDTGIATPLTLNILSGDEQSAAPGTTLPAPLRVQLVDLQSRSVGRLRVEWVVVEGGGRVSPRNTFTDADGVAEATWTVGPGAGLQIVEARVGNETATFEANGR